MRRLHRNDRFVPTCDIPEDGSCLSVVFTWRQQARTVEQVGPRFAPVQIAAAEALEVPQAWLADVLARLPDHPANKVADLLPWNWRSARRRSAMAA
jgi:hypothetical protein